MPKVNTEDLIDTSEVAELLRLSSRTAVTVYASRYGDFPLPVIERGRCRLWLRQDVEAWARSRPKRAR